MSPHPAAQQCILETVKVMHAPAVAAGLPEDALLCMTDVSLEGTQELMRCRDTGVILATGGIGLVRAAYSSGKPAYGVGPGNVPAYVEATADVPAAVKHVIDGKTFDYGTLCSSEQALICDASIRDAVVTEVKNNGGYFLNEAESAAVARVVVTPQRLANPEIVGRPAPVIAQRAGISVPPETRVLVAPLAGVGREHPLSIEKLSPVLAFYVVKDAKQAFEIVLALLRFGGAGHTAAVHSRNDALIREFALKQPVFRVVANTQSSMGATGYTTGLAPSMSLGCGALAGNVTSDNITPLHLLNVKRLAYPRARQVGRDAGPSAAPGSAPRMAPPAGQALDFVAEDDVRRALREGRRLRLGPKAIVTPSARDAAAGTDVLVLDPGA
jgi:acetaldehyde dehydrogenase (acetylating)